MLRFFENQRYLIGISLLLSSLFLGGQVRRAVTLGQSLSGDTDIYTEQTTLRSAQGYFEMGFRKNSGLPNFCYGDLSYTGMNTLGEKPWPEGPCVYTHYPQGAEWITGIMYYLIGPQKVPWYRMFPIMCWFFANGFLIIALTRLLNPLRAFWAHLLLLVIPMFTNMMHGIYFQSYVFSLFLVQLSLGLFALSRLKSISMSYLIGFFLLGHLQGWFSLDMCFLVTFFMLPLAWFESGGLERDKCFGVIKIMFVSGLGYTLAQALHFWEVVNFHGGLEAAIADFTQSAKERAQVAEISRFSLNVKYLFKYTKLKRFFNFSLGHLFIVLTFGTVIFLAKKQLIKARGMGLGMLCALLVSSLWIWVMKQHAYHHPHFITRHFFLFYFIGVLTIQYYLPWDRIFSFLMQRMQHRA